LKSGKYLRRKIAVFLGFLAKNAANLWSVNERERLLAAPASEYLIRSENFCRSKSKNRI
jgi:hypothetical protein